MSYQAMEARQLARAIPEQILASRVLEMSVTELQSYVEEQSLENPALIIDDQHRCPLCGAPASNANVCAVCGSRSDSAARTGDSVQPLAPRQATSDTFDFSDEDDLDPFWRVASETDLSSYLHGQSAIAFDGEERIIADFVIDSLDDRGYFSESLIETADLFGLSVPEFTIILNRVQEFDPPGIAATCVQECLLLQIRQAEIADLAKSLAAQIINECWAEFSRLKWAAISHKIGRPVDEVRDAVRLISERLTPYPASLYRSPWQALAPTSSRRIVPDAVIRFAVPDQDDPASSGAAPPDESAPTLSDTADGSLICEVVDFRLGSLKIDELYLSTLEQVRTSRAACSEEDRRHICDQVDRARCVLDAVALRKANLARLCIHLAEVQRDFVLMGAQGLKPMTQKQIAKELGMHESTVSRAVRAKHVQLPSGEVVPLEKFFDSALPIKDRISALVAAEAGLGPLTDGQIAARLAEQGVRVARRTVAKYRSQLQLPPAQLRVA